MKQLKHFARLVNFEFDRMFKFLLAIIVILILANLLGSVIEPMNYANNANEVMRLESLNAEEYVQLYESFSLLKLTSSGWFVGPIALGIFGLLFFSIFIWYREWLGKNTFIYRLLMLPVSRMQLYTAKLAAIFLGIFSLLAVQLIMLWICSLISPKMIPSEFYTDMSFLDLIVSDRLLFMILPNSFAMFLGMYGLGLLVLLVLFTAILFERSYRIKGFVFGVLYCIGSLGMVISPLLIPLIAHNEYILFPSETLILVVAMAVLTGIVALTVSRHLINHKITI